MRNAVFISLILTSGMAQASEWCKGYWQGYEDGYRDEIGISPTQPECPEMPPWEEGMPKDEYKRGYDFGVQVGYSAAMC